MFITVNDCQREVLVDVLNSTLDPLLRYIADVHVH